MLAGEGLFSFSCYSTFSVYKMLDGHFFWETINSDLQVD